MKKTTLRLTYTAIMIALSAVLSLIKIPPLASAALDSLPGFFTAIFIHPVLGGIIAFFGHLMTGLVSGFPLSLLGHLFIAISMFVSAFIFGFVFKKDNVFRMTVAIILAIACNIYISMPFLNFFLEVPYEYLLTLQIPLLIAAALNIGIAIIIYYMIKSTNYKLDI